MVANGSHSITAVYRIVWTDPPEIVDFESHAARGDVARFATEDARRLLTGISVFRTASQARRTARKRPPWLGRGYIARIEIPPEADFQLERTTKSAGHYTLWADPASIMTWVVGIDPVAELKEDRYGL